MFCATMKPGDSTLQGGKYIITRVLGQGGFGITYEAEQVSLGRKVAVKEFFMKEYCERDGSTSRVSVPSSGSRELVERFRQKFLKEARMIAGFNHYNIVNVHDVFEENATAYYVMEHLSGGSLYDMVKKIGSLSTDKCIAYIRQVASALDYLHNHNTLHFDVKPSNILIDGKGDRVVLIDFGISKHFDNAGNQTSSTPVGISRGYAPLEQNRRDAISTFTPATDIYSLGATLFNLATGENPPDATVVNEMGLKRPSGISDRIWNTIERAMQPRVMDRPQCIRDFLALLDGANQTVETIFEAGNETTFLEGIHIESQRDSRSKQVSQQIVGTGNDSKKKNAKGFYGFLSVIVIGLVLFTLTRTRNNGETPEPANLVDGQHAASYLVNEPSEPANGSTIQPVSGTTGSHTAPINNTSTTAGGSPSSSSSNSKVTTSNGTKRKASSNSSSDKAKSSQPAVSKVEETVKVDPVEELKKSAQAGNKDAQYELGMMYFDGNGVARNYSTAFQYLKPLAEAGYTKAYYPVADMYHRGNGVSKDRNAAEKWYKKAADTGDYKAKRILIDNF